MTKKTLENPLGKCILLKIPVISQCHCVVPQNLSLLWTGGLGGSSSDSCSSRCDTAPVPSSGVTCLSNKLNCIEMKSVKTVTVTREYGWQIFRSRGLTKPIRKGPQKPRPRGQLSTKAKPSDSILGALVTVKVSERWRCLELACLRASVDRCNSRHPIAVTLNSSDNSFGGWFQLSNKPTHKFFSVTDI